MNTTIFTFKNQDHLLKASRDELIAFAIDQVHLFQKSAEKSCITMQEYVNILTSEFIDQKFLLLWWERRELFKKMFHLRFFRFQIMALKNGELVLTIQEYAQKTGDAYSNEMYAATLPSISGLSPQSLRRFQYELEQQKELLSRPSLH